MGPLFRLWFRGPRQWSLGSCPWTGPANSLILLRVYLLLLEELRKSLIPEMIFFRVCKFLKLMIVKLMIGICLGLKFLGLVKV